LIVAGTGHRPNKLGGYGPKAFERLLALATEVLGELKPTRVISGMALGWDQALAQAAVSLGIPLVAAVPFDGQEAAWPEASQHVYRELLARATEVIVVCPGGYSARSMQRRNEWMVAHSDLLLALWDGTSGGTGNCIRHARRVDRCVLNVWSRFSPSA